MADNYYNGKIVGARPVQHRFKPEGDPAFELMVEVELFDEQGASRGSVETFLDFSMDYGRGNNANKTQVQLSFEYLSGLGFRGQDLSPNQLQALAGKTCRVLEKTADKDGNAYPEPRYFLVSRRSVQTISDAGERLRQMMQGVAGFNGGPRRPQGFGVSPQQPDNDPFAGM